MRYKKLEKLFGTAGFKGLLTPTLVFSTFVVNTRFGLKLEQRLENLSLFNRILPFQIIEASNDFF